MMKHGLKPTRKQKMAIKAAGLNPGGWLVSKFVNGELHLVSRVGDNQKIIKA